MSTTIGFSSELYYIEPQDILNLTDTPANFAKQIAVSDPITVLLGNADHRIADTLVCGRSEVRQAVAHKVALVPVRFVFISNIAKWNILPIFFKALRQNFKFRSQEVYHTTLKNLKEMHIERGFRNAENAYDISKRWHISPEERVRKYNHLLTSLKTKGFDDRYPISIMLCRRCGVKDCVDDGHHRIGICAENHIERIAICFRAAGTLPHGLQKILLKFFNLFPKKTC